MSSPTFESLCVRSAGREGTSGRAAVPPVPVLSLGIARVYLARRFAIRAPFGLAVLIYLTAALDGVGDYFGLYSRTFRWLQ